MLSKAECLQKTVEAMKQVSENLTDPKRDDPHEFKVITIAGGRQGFRYTQVVTVNGEQIEVTVRKSARVDN